MSWLNEALYVVSLMTAFVAVDKLLEKPFEKLLQKVFKTKVLKTKRSPKTIAKMLLFPAFFLTSILLAGIFYRYYDGTLIHIADVTACAGISMLMSFLQAECSQPEIAPMFTFPLNDAFFVCLLTVSVLRFMACCMGKCVQS